VSLTVYSSSYNDTKTRTDYVVVTNPGGGGIVPTASFVATPLVGEAALTVAFTNTSDFADTFYWDFGDGGFSFEIEPVYVYNAPGLYTVSLTAYLGMANDTMTRVQYIAVGTPTFPTAYFDALPLSVCTNTDVNFYNQSINFTSSFWDFGDGGTSTDENPIHQYADTGSYDVTLTVSSSSYFDTMVRFGYINVYYTTCACLWGYTTTINEVTWALHYDSGAGGSYTAAGSVVTMDLPVKGAAFVVASSPFCVDVPSSVTFSFAYNGTFTGAGSAFVDIYLDGALVSPSLNTSIHGSSGTYVLSRSLSAGGHVIAGGPVLGGAGVYGNALGGFGDTAAFDFTLNITVN
jgi:PKD repeat protein